ncbi:CU044_5270 family protein [Dactylosporangium sp. NPDC050688]|uniref:CU044_5270 family protein n=1 Tax=Dactylosporangium sp. NPDC050688 TaxID=3157217 RepID=UPI00340D71F8
MKTGTTMRQLGEALDPPAGIVPFRARHRVFSGLSTAPARWRGRLLLAGAAAAVAVLLAGGVAVVAVRTVPGAPAENSEALAVLTRAAAFVRLESPLSPKVDQFVFVEIKAWGPGRGPDAERVALIRSWRSVNGDVDGLVQRDAPGEGGRLEFPIPGCRNGRAPEWTGDGRLDATRTRPCESEPGYRANLPTGPDGMLTFLRQLPAVAAGSQSAFAAAADLLQQTYIQPQARAALFLAVAKLPGVTVRSGVADAAGRAGVAVGQGNNTARQELIFEPETGQFLGTQMNILGDEPTALRPTALLRNTIVNRIGELPV